MLKLGGNPTLTFQAGVDPGRAWELNVYADNMQLLNRVIAGTDGGARKWEEVKVDLGKFAGQTALLRLYQRVLLPNKTAGNAYWKAIEVR